MTGVLVAALNSVDWQKNIADLSADADAVLRIERSNYLLAVWAGQIEQVDASSPAVAFLREMQHAGHNVASLIALGLYKPAAASMRAVVECALYYTYFRSHLAELATLVRESTYYVTKSDVIEFHKVHTPEFTARQSQLAFLSRLNSWYSRTSAVVHGQVPGSWSCGAGLSATRYDSAIAREASLHFEEAATLVQDAFLCCIAIEHWRYFESTSKAFILKGMAGSVKAALRLDAA